MIEYRDPVTGYSVRRYTEGPERNAKLYFTCENFSLDDRHFFFMKQQLPGREMALMKLDPAGFVDGKRGESHTGNIIIADKDGRHFDIAASSEQLLHPCISRDGKWLCADRISYLGVDIQEGVVLIERATGKAKLIATTGTCKSGADHQHPSFNRRGDMIRFSNPDENGNAQVCTIDLRQVMEDW